MKRLLGTVATVAALALVAGCGDDSGGNSAGSGSGSGPSASAGGVSGTITVFAAASLTESFGTLGKQFEAAHPGTTVKFNFAASSALAENINQGAPADVFASASAALGYEVEAFCASGIATPLTLVPAACTSVR